jgi:hypothetical protein
MPASGTFNLGPYSCVIFSQGDPPNPADLDGNGSVGATDLAMLLAAWGTTGGAADLDGNGSVGATDLAALLAAWG